MFEKLKIRNKELEELEVQESWTVQWTSRSGEYSTSISKEFKVFPLKSDAKLFKEALDYAYKILNHTSNIEVLMYKN